MGGEKRGETKGTGENERTWETYSKTLESIRPVSGKNEPDMYVCDVTHVPCIAERICLSKSRQHH